MANKVASKTLPLSMVSVGEPVRLVKVRAGKRLVNRLTSMGLTPGVEMRIVQDTGGPLTIAVRDSRVALGHGVAHKILVELIE
jgi:Fe2+ transport system protein FeoA